MKQIVINYLIIFVIPLVIGLAVRILLNRFNRSYFVTVALAVLTLIAWVIAIINPLPGNESFALRAVQVTCAFGAALVVEIILRLKKK